MGIAYTRVLKGIFRFLQRFPPFFKREDWFSPYGTTLTPALSQGEGEFRRVGIAYTWVLKGIFRFLQRFPPFFKREDWFSPYGTTLTPALSLGEGALFLAARTVALFPPCFFNPTGRPTAQRSLLTPPISRSWRWRIIKVPP